MKYKTIKFKGYECNLDFGFYLNGGGTAIRLIDKTDGQLIATATMNCIRAKLNNNEVVIKDYGENAGIKQALIDAGVIKDTGKCIHLPHTTANVCRIISEEEEEAPTIFAKYVLILWPDSQSLMEKPWFDECVLADQAKAGSSAYFVPIKYVKEL